MSGSQPQLPPGLQTYSPFALYDGNSSSFAVPQPQGAESEDDWVFESLPEPYEVPAPPLPPPLPSPDAASSLPLPDAGQAGPSSDDSEQNLALPDPEPTPRRFCTQRCLLGVKRREPLDPDCPNMPSHLGTRTGPMKHPITGEQFVRLVGLQLSEDRHRARDRGTGPVFKLELAPYGYTFVGKAIQPRHVGRLAHECSVYTQMEAIQGWHVPVYLGFVHLDKDYVLPGGVEVAHMLLTSWGGENLADSSMSARALRASYQQSLSAVVAHGINGSQAKRRWNPERRRVMLVNFELP